MIVALFPHRMHEETVSVYLNTAWTRQRRSWAGYPR